ncbi:hypothetical protein DFH07DRAFT_781990 [Mycena maculata]|uniref:DUF6534 domain-containing protein n=1 Tax=Mycena maculata TaxID=230809 RepID=A0AAD7MRB8_9AGAR|nr:hypothetical protein DFH07DRAFT_781990 [Mycena maculata]
MTSTSPSDPTAAAAALAQELIALMPSTMGATLIGLFLSSVFYGVTLLQTYQYYNKYGREDNWYLFALVGVLTALDSFAVISNMKSSYFYLISNFANLLAILQIDWSLTIVFGLASFVLAVQKFKKNTVYMSLMYHNGSLLYIPTITWISSSSLGCSLGADILIASTMVMYLSRGRQQGFRKTDNVLRKLMIYSINTGLITAICTTITLVLGEVLSSTFYNTIFYYPLSKCYVNSMLGFLNACESLRTQAGMNSFNLTALPHSSGNGCQHRKYGNNEVFGEPEGLICGSLRILE